MDYSLVLLSIAVAFCFFMTWGVGANDLANVMSTTMGSKAITVRQAMLIAIIFEFAGAFIGGSGVTETMRDGIINSSELSSQPLIMIEGMLSVLLACTVWMNLASYLGVPVSITNALVGSMVGFGSVVLGTDAIHWNQVIAYAIGWVTSPLDCRHHWLCTFHQYSTNYFYKKRSLRKSKTLYSHLSFLMVPYFLLLLYSKG